MLDQECGPENGPFDGNDPKHRLYTAAEVAAREAAAAEAMREAGAAIAQEQCDQASNADRCACLYGAACACRSNAAAAVAAFLRHYSKRSPTALIYGPAVADDVERAVKEGRDG